MISKPSFIVLALFQGKGKLKYEVGLAFIDLYYPHIMLYQISDDYVYSNTLAKINLLYPQEIIFPANMIKNFHKKVCLHQIIKSQFKNINITAVPAIHFSALVGWDLIQAYCTNNAYSIQQVLKKRFYALSAVSALIKYIVSIQNIIYAPNTVKIEFRNNYNFAVIHLEAVQSLEILCSLNKALPKFSLFDVMNKCVTPLGKKFLRANLLQPLYNIQKIEDRLMCVTELIADHTLLSKLQRILRKFKYVEYIINVCPGINDYEISQQAEKNLNYLLYLKHSLEILPELNIVLSLTSCSTLQTIKSKISKDSYACIQNLISELIHKDACCNHGFTSSNLQRCFAIKPKINDLLDIVRQAYCELIDTIIQYVHKLSNDYSLCFTLNCNNNLGYYMDLNTQHNSSLQKYDLPKDIILIKKQQYNLLLTTEQLLIYSNKCKEICEEIHIISNVLIVNLLGNLNVYITFLFELSTCISKLDFLASLALISSKSGFVCPRFSHKLCLIDSYHPIQLLTNSENCVYNNVIASVPYNFHIITGPNLSGKTLYLKQIILLSILAQIGCYVPAKNAEFRLSDRLLFHSCYYSNMGTNESSFEKEMRGLKLIIDSLTHNALIGLDEPCVSTNFQEGTSLAVSICVKILSTKAFGFCSTHHYYLTKISESFLNVTNLHFDCHPKISTSINLIYTHKLKIGASNVEYYGIAAARMSSLPKSLISGAEAIAKKISIKVPIKLNLTESKMLNKKYYTFIAKIYNLIKIIT
ncbi:mutS homolog 4 [Nasonia vitripennis]|uniref:MSH4 n=3 Tax=Nasonia vitripennis TaxID=7425 RepID=A0A7M6ULI3_NASVI|nr:mutS homolog 4 [Nasonia vitripennis]